MNIPSKVQSAVDYAARDVARAIVDEYRCHTDYSAIVRSLAFMLRASASGSIGKFAKSDKWTDQSIHGWLTRAADAGPGGLDKDALSQAIQQWWSELADDAKFRVIMSTHPDTQFVNEQVQKLMNKTEADLSALDPRLLEIYRGHGSSEPKKNKDEEAPAAEPDKAADPQHAMKPQPSDGGQKSQPEPMQPLQHNK